MFENEDWVPISQLPHYSVSNRGRVKNTGTDKIRKQAINDGGFPIITLYGADSKTRYLRQVNKLVAEAFLPTSIFHEENAVWHIDGNLANCDVENLRWDHRGSVLEWNEMHRTLTPKLKTPRVRNNRTGEEYDNAFDCGMAEGFTETQIAYKVERVALHMEDDNARFRYVFGDVR